MKEIHANHAQLEAIYVNARTLLCVMGRGTGKSDFITAPRIIDNVQAMPRSVGGLIVPNYANYQKIWDSIKKGFEKLGWRHGEHYIVSKQPPQAWEKGLSAPIDADKFKNYVSFFNGSGFYILSAKTGHNGANLDWLAVEEAKLIPDAFFRETYLAVRGLNVNLFGHLPNYGSLTVVTDRPRPNDYQWLYEYEKAAKTELNQDTIELIKASNIKRDELQKQLITDKLTDKGYLERQIRHIERELVFFRKKAVHFLEASSLENIHVLGIEKIQEWQKLGDYDFAVSVLNLKPPKVQDAFYHYFSPKIHSYQSQNDIIPNVPFHIGLDYNSAICCLEVVQIIGEEFRVVRSFDSTEAMALQAVCAKFADFCKEYPQNKLIHYHYDHTAKQGRGANNDLAYYQTVELELRKAKLYVVPNFIGYTVSHEERRKYYNALLAEELPTKFRYNAHYCQNLASSLAGAELIYYTENGKTKTKKSKKNETNAALDQTVQTHHSEALDTLVQALLIKKQNRKVFEDV